MSDTVELPLSKGKVTIIDAADFEKVGHLKWYYSSGGYACRTKKVNGKKRTVQLHRVLMDAPDKKQVDHINGDTLDNRSANLRLCTQAENKRNRKAIGGKSKYVGVRPGRRNAWRAQIKTNGKYLYLGLYLTEKAAARAYDAAARKLYGEFASLNFPKVGERGALSD